MKSFLQFKNSLDPLLPNNFHVGVYKLYSRASNFKMCQISWHLAAEKQMPRNYSPSCPEIINLLQKDQIWMNPSWEITDFLITGNSCSTTNQLIKKLGEKINYDFSA